MAYDDLPVIRRLLQEAESHVEALKKIEAMLQGQVNGRSAATAIPLSQNAGSSVEGNSDESGNTGVKARVGEILLQSGGQGMRPRDIVPILQKEFTFRSRQTAAASVSSALTRFRAKGYATKMNNGRYVWVEH